MVSNKNAVGFVRNPEPKKFSLNRENRKKELMRISLENQAILRRL
jgi:hypothetical protein